jgi:EAL domain-containing protein (putative c-di-GMP-specific phosphodiesterase class I)
MIDDLGATLTLLHRLKDLGVHIAMDDFGTGFSSLSLLRTFPFDKIKIDQSFVGELGNKNDSEAIVRAVTGLCESLGVTATAEGVETGQQLAMLRHVRCTEIQGYLVSKPRPAREIPVLLAEFSRGGIADQAP